MECVGAIPDVDGIWVEDEDGIWGAVEASEDVGAEILMSMISQRDPRVRGPFGDLR